MISPLKGILKKPMKIDEVNEEEEESETSQKSDLKEMSVEVPITMR
jgi:hypothetical protein